MMRLFSATLLSLLLCASLANAAEKPLIVASDATWPPIEMLDENKNVVGYSIDYLKAVAKEAGLNVEFRNTAWDGIFAALESRQADIIASSVTITDKRKKAMLFTDPYYESGLMTIVRKDNTVIHSLADLKGKRIGVQLGTTGAQEAEKIEGAKVTNFDTSDLACLELKNGNVDAVISDLPVLEYFLKKGGASYAKTVGTPKKGDFYGIAAPKGKKELIDGLNKALKELKDSGEYQKIHDKWFGAETK